MKIAVRVDSSKIMGTGHVRRCLLLSKEFRELGHDVIFVCRNFEGNLISMINENKFPVTVLEGQTKQGDSSGYSAWLPDGWESDANNTKALLKSVVDLLIVDHYAIDSKWHNSARGIAKKILVIDDLANRQYDCDIILDQNYYRNLESRYDGLIPKDCRKFLGPEYVLLASEYLSLQPSPRVKLRTLLISFGGTDPTNETQKTLEAVKDLNLDVTVILGAASLTLDFAQKHYPNVKFLSYTARMAELMIAADLSIGGGGTTSYERCMAGLPSIVIAVAENQEAIARDLSSLGVLDYLGASSSVSSHTILNAVQKYIENPMLLRAASQSARKLWAQEPIGARGVARLLLSQLLQLNFRLATAKDSEQLLQWRNDPLTRENSINTEIVDKEDHENWLSRALKDPTLKLYIIELENKPIGTVRFNLKGGACELSWTISPEFRGKGYGKSMVRDAAALHKRNVTARIKKHNLASIRIVESLDFTLKSQVGDVTIWEKLFRRG